MANSQHIEVLRKGVNEWNLWRTRNTDSIPDFSKIDFLDVFGHFFDYKGINLSGANLESASLFCVDLDEANLEGASLQNCNCYSASFKNSNLRDVDLQLANLTLSNLDNSNLDGAYLGNTVFGNCNLSNVKNLITCEHLHSSIIDHLTLIESENLPKVFLRGCGLPDFIIDNILSLKHEAILFHSCFISYSSKDDDFAKTLYKDLQNSGIRCWLASQNLKAGKKTYEQITEAIHIHERVLLILSSDSMQSTWVATEIKKARIREHMENRPVLFPISLVPYSEIAQWELFDSDLGLDLAAEIRKYHILNFSNRRSNVDYRTTVDELIDALKK